MPDRKPGKAFLIGAGPGDVELLTLKAIRCIGLCDVLLVDSLVNPEVLGFARHDAVVINVGKRGGRVSADQKMIEETMVLHARQGKNVARIKGGDPVIFARGGEELEALAQSGIEVEIVSGVTSGIGVPSALGIPLTHRDMAHQVVFLTGHSFGQSDEPALPMLDSFKGTIVVYMGLQRVRPMMDALFARGLPADALMVAIQSGTTAEQRSIFSEARDFVQAVEQAKMESPVLIVIGDVVRLSAHYRPQMAAAGVSALRADNPLQGATP